MQKKNTQKNIKLVTLDPGHFHAALIQKVQYNQVSPKVSVYAPDGEDVKAYVSRINNFNIRKENPTNWELNVYKGSDFLKKMILEKSGNVMITAGKNNKRIEYIKAAIHSRMNVLADKPMCIDKDEFKELLEVFKSAKKNDVLLYDIMTERSEITSILMRELINTHEIFGTIVKGSVENPAVEISGVHHFFKYVDGEPLKRPTWYFDSSQQGDGLVDVTTHFVDLIQWELFYEESLNYKNDVEVISAKHWTTKLTLEQFTEVTKSKEFPLFLKSKLDNNILPVFSNGEINYTLKDIYAKVKVEWKYQAEEGGGDTYTSIVRGTKSNIIIKQDKEQNYKREIFIEVVGEANKNEFNRQLKKSIIKLQNKYGGIEVERQSDFWHLIIPNKYRIDHETRFVNVMERYLDYISKGKLPKWEVPNMIAKYYITTEALRIADS